MLGDDITVKFFALEDAKISESKNPKHQGDVLGDVLEDRILDELRRNPSLNQKELANMLHTSVPSVQRAMSRLKDDGRHITIIEDDKALNDGIVLALKNTEFTFTQNYSLGEFCAGDPTDLIILDVNLPDGSGFDFLREYREVSDTPVIILTAKDLETDEVTGLTLGADDYITKPFSLMVLRARIDKVLQKRQMFSGNSYSDDEYSFDFDRMEFLARGMSVELSKTEQKLLRLLIQNREQTLTRDMLIDAIWTDGAEYVDENALSVTIGRLRKKLSATERIQTVYGIGYVWRSR